MYAYLFVAIVAAGAAFSGAWKVQDWRYQSKETARVEAEAERYRENSRAGAQAEQKLAEVKTVIQKEFVTINRDVDHVIEKPVYRNICFDDPGMRILRDAIGTNPANSADAGRAMPGSDAAK